MSLSTTLPNLENAYTEPIYNSPKPKQTRASLSRRTASPRGEKEDQQAILKQWHELMQKIQKERQEISALQEEADQKQTTVDKNSLTPELKKLMDQVQDLKDDKRDLDDSLARIRQKFTPEAKADINDEVFNLRKELFFDTEALETIKDNIKKMEDKARNFENEEPAKSIIEAEKRITELTHKLDDLYVESAQIDVDFEEIFNPSSSNGEKKENRKITYLKRKLQQAEAEVEKKTQEIQQIMKDHEKAKEQISLREEEEERKKKFRAELSKSRRREMIAQQCKAAGLDVESEENKEEENKSKTDDDMDLEKMLGLNYDILNSTKQRKRKKSSKKKSTKKADSAKADNSKADETNDTKTSTTGTKKTTKKSKKNIENTNNNTNDEDNIFNNAEDNKNIANKDSVLIDEEKDLVNIGQSDSDSGVKIIEDNDVGELAHKINDALLTNDESKDDKDDNEDDKNDDNKDDENKDNENTEDKDEISDNKENEEGSTEKDQKQNDDNKEYYIIECTFNHVTLLDVSPESFSKSPAGNFSSMLSSGLNLLKNDKDSKKLHSIQIKVAKHNQDEHNELTIWNSQDADDEETDQSSVNILPLYDIEYNQDWKIVSKTLKSKTQPVSRKSKDNQIENDESNEAKEGEEDKTDNIDQKKTTEASETEKKADQTQNSENDANVKNEEGKNLSSVLDETNSLFTKTDNKTTEESKTGENKENEAKDKKQDQKEGEETNEAEEKAESQNENEENKKENGEETEKTQNDEENKKDENETKNDDEEEIKKPTDVEENLDILNGVCGTSPDRGEVQENREKKTFQTTVLVDGFLREDRPSEPEEFDSMVLINISPSPLFAKLSDVFKKKGIVSAGKFNYDI